MGACFFEIGYTKKGRVFKKRALNTIAVLSVASCETQKSPLREHSFSSLLAVVQEGARKASLLSSVEEIRISAAAVMLTYFSTRNQWKEAAEACRDLASSRDIGGQRWGAQLLNVLSMREERKNLFPIFRHKDGICQAIMTNRIMGWSSGRIQKKEGTKKADPSSSSMAREAARRKQGRAIRRDLSRSYPETRLSL